MVLLFSSEEKEKDIYMSCQHEEDDIVNSSSDCRFSNNAGYLLYMRWKFEYKIESDKELEHDEV